MFHSSGFLALHLGYPSILISFFACSYPVVTLPLLQGLLESHGIYNTHHLWRYIWVYFGNLNSISLMYMADFYAITTMFQLV